MPVSMTCALVKMNEHSFGPWAEAMAFNSSINLDYRASFKVTISALSHRQYASWLSFLRNWLGLTPTDFLKSREKCSGSL